MKRLTSFMSEHTAEYVLVPNIVRQLSAHFCDIIPMYFWSTREGNRTADEFMSARPARILTVFPRRPKVSETVEERITMKVNQELIGYTRVSLSVMIPVFAGVPLVSSLLALRIESPCSWRFWKNAGAFASAIKTSM